MVFITDEYGSRTDGGLWIVERSSGYWIVDELGVAYDEQGESVDPFIELKDAIAKLKELENND
tara:strand:+ start:413 stop:601 length:189 start_codon:yes stop_codon:yes gene_type:complete